MTTLHGLLEVASSGSAQWGREFEALCAWWLRNDPMYRRLLRKVWLWGDWPGRDGPDTGIDLVAETFAGEFWAIQCKGYAPGNTVTKRDVDSFLAESGRPPFVYRLLIASTDRLSTNAKRTMDRQERGVGYVLRSDLAASAVTWPVHLGELLVDGAPTPKRPLAHQERALDHVVSGLATEGRGQLVMACGTGKTLVSLWAHERLSSQATLVLLPSLSLLAQALREWAANASDVFHFQAVCSDDTVSDQMVSQTSALGVPTTTDPGAVAAFMRRDGVRVVFATYQSSDRVAEALSGSGLEFDLIVADEAHRTAGRKAGVFATVLDDELLPAKRRLFMTATPRYYTHRVRAVAGSDGLAVASMDDPETYGPVLYRLGFTEAVSENLLSDYRVVVVGITDAQYRRWVESGRLVTTDGSRVSEARRLAGELALAKAMTEYDLRRVITFHNRIAAARAFAEELTDVIEWMPVEVRPSGSTASDYVSGEMPSGARYAKLRQLGDPVGADRAVLANAQCLSEGVDVPALDGVAFIEPRRSQVDIVQAVGRVMRKSPGKELGTILLPIFIDGDLEDPDKAIAASNFQPLWSLIRALRAHDDALAEQLDVLRRKVGRSGQRGDYQLPDKIVLDLPVDLPVAFIDALVLRVITESTLAFEEWMGTLATYVDEFGSARVPVAYVTPDGRRLGRWVALQRADYLAGRLDAARAEALETLPDWVWHVFDESWSDGLGHLLRFVDEHRHARVPQSYRTEDGFGLGRWVGGRRREFARGNLAQERVAQLEQVAGWSWDVGAETWMAIYDCFAEFAKGAGHARPPKDVQTPGGRSLQDWAGHQRRLRRRDLLQQERIELLEALPGWSWEANGRATVRRDRKRWDAKYRVLRQFAQTEGHARPLQKAVYQGERIGRWVSEQRVAYREGRLPEELVGALEALPGWVWHVHDIAWEDGFRRMADYATAHGTSYVPPEYVHPDGTNIRAWANGQRKIEAAGRMKPERYERLSALPGWWWYGDVGRGSRVVDVLSERGDVPTASGKIDAGPSE